jgi:hypothetical protein
MEICGHEYSLYVDYDRGKFGYLDLLGKVKYIRERVDRDLIRPCQLALRHQHRVAVGLLVPGLVCAGISAAATFLNGERTRAGQHQAVFVAFIRKYMDRDLQGRLVKPGEQRVTDYADWLYLDVRCGLAHAFALEWGHIEDSRLGTYVRLADDGQPQINQDRLLADFARGWQQYLDTVSAAPGIELSDKFVIRFDQVFHD